jgi:hypothetical protein
VADCGSAAVAAGFAGCVRSSSTHPGAGTSAESSEVGSSEPGSSFALSTWDGCRGGTAEPGGAAGPAVTGSDLATVAASAATLALPAATEAAAARFAAATEATASEAAAPATAPEAADEAAAGEEPVGEEPTGEEPTGEEPTGEEPVAVEDSAGEEAAGEDAPSEDAASEETAGEEEVGEDTAGAETAGEDAASEDAPAACSTDPGIVRPIRRESARVSPAAVHSVGPRCPEADPRRAGAPADESSGAA